MMDILPNLLPVAFTLMMWLLSLVGKGETKQDRALSRGFGLALFVTFVAAVPPFLLAASVDFRSLEMMFMLTLPLALVSVLAGLIAFAVGYSSVSGEEEKPERSPRVMAQLKRGAPPREDAPE